MRNRTEEAWKKCPKCGRIENQVKAGRNSSGSQRCECKECGIYYTIEPKGHEYPEETRELAIKMYYGGVSVRGVGKILGMNKTNVMNWIKKALRTEKAETIPKIRVKTVELDELYWFLECKPRTETRKNIYIMTMVTREPQQITGHVVSRDKTSRTIQKM